jgi:hypothetical protein
MSNKRIVSTQEFNAVVDARIDKIRNVLQSKAKEYATNDDRMHNFNWAAQLDGETPEQALWGMFKKHLCSVHDLVVWSECCPEKITEHLIDEKIGDTINYCILLEAMLNKLMKDKQKKEA